jgi:hypothetical protein
LNGKKQNGCQKQDDQPFENRTGQQNTTSLDRFGKNKIFVLLIKGSRLAIQNPDIFVRI